MATASKQRQPRLRASCDGCFLAKVKCSKARPICSRCLQSGIECRYSPSSRAGKPKASDSAKSHQQSPTAPTSNAAPRPPAVNEDLTWAMSTGLTGVYNLDAGWTTPPTTFDEALCRSQSASSGLTFMGVDGSTADLDACMSGDIYGPTMPWTPPNDMPAIFRDSPAASALPSVHSRSHSYDKNNNALSWVDSTSPDTFSFNQLPSPPTCNIARTFFPSPTATPTVKAIPKKQASTPLSSSGGSCICFTLCLQSLQALYNAASPSSPPFDVVLSLNRKAVEGCAAMLGEMSMVSPENVHLLTNPKTAPVV